jgi:hypothetical protein
VGFIHHYFHSIFIIFTLFSRFGGVEIETDRFPLALFIPGWALLVPLSTMRPRIQI